MTRLRLRLVHGVSLSVFALCLTFLAPSAWAAREAATEAGHWLGFGHQMGVMADGSLITTDLVPTSTTPGSLGLQGTINGLPYIERPLRAFGYVTPFGQLTLFLTGDGIAGFCDGSVRPIPNFGQGSGQDDLGSLNYFLVDSAGNFFSGHLNLLHMFGGMGWSQLPAVQLPAVQSQRGSFLPPGGDMAGGASTMFDKQLGSSIIGVLDLGPQMFNMVGTTNARGSLVMMCDGSVRNADGTIVGLIGLLFTGGVFMPPGAAPMTSLVGTYAQASFGELLPAVRTRAGALFGAW